MSPVALWQRWVAFTGREVDARSLALVRVLACGVLLLDLLRVWQLDMVTIFWRTYEHGGLTRFSSPHGYLDAWPELGGPVAFGVACVALLLGMLGIATRPALLVAVVAYAQLGHLYPPGDRGIDRILRTVLFLLVFSGAHKRLALLGAEAGARIRAWPADVIRWMLVLVYMSAGIHKLRSTPEWLGGGDPPVLMRILANPLAGSIDPQLAAELIPLWRLGGVFTIVLELAAPLILTRFGPWWAVLGIALHLGIAATMELGMFAWGMMTLYPVILAPWILRAWDRGSAR